MAFNFLVWAGLLVAQLVLQRLMVRKPRGARSEFDPPSVEEGRLLPLVFGTQRVVPTIAWYGDSETDEGDNDSTEYYARMVCWLALGPLTQILDLQWGDKSIALHPASKKSNDADLDYVTLPSLPIARQSETDATTLVKVHALDLFGGPKTLGGVAGQLMIHWGLKDQEISQVVVDHFNTGTASQDEASAWPRYAYLVLGQSPDDGPFGTYDDLLEDGQFYHVSNSPQPQDFAAIVEHIPKGLLELNLDAGYTSSGLTFAQKIDAARIGQDANPGEVIYAVATDPVLGAGRDSVELHLPSLGALAKTCRDEQLGVSLTVEGESALEIIDEVLRHIDGVRYQDPDTGKLAVMLLRADYVLNDQLEVTPSNASEIRLDRVATGNDANELRVRYSHYEAGTGRGEVTGEVLTSDLEFPYLWFELLQAKGRHITDVTVYVNGTPLTEGEDEDYVLFAASGTIRIRDTDNVSEGDTITIDYTGDSTFLGYREGLTAPAQNLADIAETGHVRSETLDFPWLSTERNGNIALARQMTRAVQRLRVLEATLNREAYGVHVGSVLRVNLPKHQLTDAAFRVTRVEEERLEEGGIQVWAIEDVFALPLNPSAPVGGGDDPAGGLPTAPAIALSVVTPGAIRIGLHPADTNFQIEVRRADDLLETGLTVITPAGGLPGTTPYLDDPWPESTVKFYSGRLIRSGWLPGPWSPWLEATATAGTPGEPSCVVPTWATSKSETATDGTATLTPTDPQLRILSVEAKTKAGLAAESGWATLSAPYQQLVAFSGSERSTVTFRVTYLACDGNEVSVEVPVHFDAPVLSSLVAAFDGSGNLTGQFAHTGASIRLAGAIGSAPADATVDGATAIDQTTGVSGTLATATTAGSVGHVKARLYSGAGGTGRPSAYFIVQVTFGVGGAGLGLSYLTAADETETLTGSRQLVEGTGIAFDDSIPGQRVISATGGGGGAGTCLGELLIDDATGEFLYDDATGDILYEDGDCEACSCEEDALTDLYVNPSSGNDTTGDGSSGAPFATVAKALSTLSRSVGVEHTIHLADGTYAEPLDLTGFVCTGDGLIVLQGNTSSPSSVTFTGSTSFTFRGLSKSAIAQVAGPVRVRFSGIRVSGTATYGFHAREGCHVYLDRVVTAGTLVRAAQFMHGARVELQGDITLAGFSDTGLEISYNSLGTYTVSGTLTITGNPSTYAGIHLSWNSHLSVFDVAGCSFSISGVKYGFAVGLQSSFGHLMGGSTISITNASTPSNSAAILGTDHSTWATNGGAALVVDHFTNLFELNSLSYGEAIGSRTITNTSVPGSVGQNSVTYLP